MLSQTNSSLIGPLSLICTRSALPIIFVMGVSGLLAELTAPVLAQMASAQSLIWGLFTTAEGMRA